MHAIEIVLLLLALMIVFALVANKLKVAFPILLTLGGLVIGLIPQLPVVTIDSSVVLLVFLPPILYSAAWYTHFKDFKKNIEPITVLALGLVLTTCVGIAYTAHWLIPGFTIATGFLLGAVVSPPDAVAATAVLKTIRVPKKIVTILEGESLVNDATALVAFQLALITINTGVFSFQTSLLKFFTLAIGGITIGFLIGYIAYLLHKFFRLDTGVEIVLTFVTAYASYIIAERFHCSGVLSTVTAGLFIGSKQATLHTANMRIKAVAVWEFTNVVLNGIIFIIIGLQLPVVVSHIQQFSIWQLGSYGLIISIAVVVIRFSFIFLVDGLSNTVRRKLKMPTVFPSKKHTTVLAYTAMRGIVSLAAVFSIPDTLNTTTPYRIKDTIVFITFIVILFTLVLQGLLLPLLIKRLHFTSEDDTNLLHKKAIRKELATAAFTRMQWYVSKQHIDNVMATGILNWHEREMMMHSHESVAVANNKQLRIELLYQSVQAKKERLLALYNAQTIDVETYHHFLHELDLEEARISH